MNDQTIDQVSASASVDALLAEFLAAQAAGNHPSIEDYVARYPQLAASIRTRFPVAADTRTAGTDLTIDFSPPEKHDAVMKLQRLGDFHILREIGRGGMGVVYEAEQESLRRRVALKVLLAGSLLDERQLSRFQREARAAARLHHTNIVPVFGVGEHENINYYVMQFIPGRGLDGLLVELRWLGRNRQSLASLARRAARAPVAATPSETTLVDVAQKLLSGQQRLKDLSEEALVIEEGDSGQRYETVTSLVADQSADSARGYWFSVARIGYQVADALAYAHDQGILHRDIKPANLLLDQKGTVWVTDFGLAKAAEQDNLTQTGDVVGTLRYMAPEQFRGLTDARTDIYALGLTLYELVALRPAFDAMDRSLLMRQVTNAEIPQLRKICPQVPSDLETIVLKALERDPAHRYQSAADFAADLQHFIHDEPILARRATLPQRLARWYRHNPVVARLCASLIIVFLAGFAGVTWKWRDAEYHRRQLKTANQEINRQRLEAVKARDEETQAKDEMKRQASKAEALNKFLVNDLLALAAPDKALGKVYTVEEVVHLAGKQLDDKPLEDAEVEASIRDAIGTTLFRLNQDSDAEAQLSRALQLSERVLPKDHEFTLGVVNNLATVLKRVGRLDEAETLYRRAYEGRRAHEARPGKLKPDPRASLGTLSNLAQLLQVKGESAEAEKLYRQCLREYEEKVGDSDPDTLLAAGNLGQFLCAQGNLVEAEPLLSNVAVKLAQAFPADSPIVLTARHNLAALWHQLGQRDKAEKALREVLDARRRVLKKDDVSTLMTINLLATVLQDQGKYREAEPLLRNLYETYLRVLPEEHQQTCSARHNLARLLQADGRLDEAEPLVRQNVEIYQRKFRPDDHDTLEFQSSLGMLLLNQGKVNDAEQIFRSVLETQRRARGPVHEDALRAVNNLVLALVSAGNLAEAEPLLQQNAEVCRRELGPKAAETLLALSNLGQLLMTEGKWDDAARVVEETYKLHREARPDADGDPETLNAADALVTVYLAQNRFREAELLVRSLLETRSRKLSPEHRDTLLSKSTLALILTEQNKLPEAIAVRQQLFDQYRDLAGPTAPETLAALKDLALAHAVAGQVKLAEPLLVQLLESRRAEIPPAPAAIAEAEAELGHVIHLLKRPQEAEPMLRRAVLTDRKALPEGHPQTACAESLLGDCLVTLQRYDEAEPLLVASCGLLIYRHQPHSVVRQAMRRVIHLYEAWGKESDAQKWRTQLDEAEKLIAPQAP